jgi:hypothetical protein
MQHSASLQFEDSPDDLIPKRSRIDVHAFLIRSARPAAEKSGEGTLLLLELWLGAILGAEFVGWFDWRIGSEDPVSNDAAVAAAATLRKSYDLHDVCKGNRRMTHLSNVPKTSILLEEIGPDSLTSSLLRSVALSCSPSPRITSWRPSLCCDPAGVMRDDSLPIAVGSSVAADGELEKSPDSWLVYVAFSAVPFVSSILGLAPSVC